MAGAFALSVASDGGTKSGSRKIFREAGVELPLGFEDEPITRTEGHLHDNRTHTDTKVSPEDSKPRDEPISVMPIKQRKHDSIFTNWTPEKGINYTPKEF